MLTVGQRFAAADRALQRLESFDVTISGHTAFGDIEQAAYNIEYLSAMVGGSPLACAAALASCHQWLQRAETSATYGANGSWESEIWSARVDLITAQQCWQNGLEK